MSWIKVKDRLPEESNPVIIAYVSEYSGKIIVGEGQLLHSYNIWHDGQTNKVTGVFKWQPLPEVPVKEDDDLEFENLQICL